MNKVVVFLLLLPLFTRAQEMPSPNQAGLIKLQNVPVNQYNGVASVGVPLYTVDGGGGLVPIALQYNTSGIKVSEVASSVGLGWNLIAGGSISRVMRDIPDESGSFKNGITTTELRHRLKNRDTYDGEKDLFFFSYPGGGGKFIFSGTPFINEDQDTCKQDCFENYTNNDQYLGCVVGCSFTYPSKIGYNAGYDYDIITLPHSELKIGFFYHESKSNSYWTITDPYGVRYYFGSNTDGTAPDATKLEVSKYNSAQALSDPYDPSAEKEFISTWHLSRIEYPNVPKSQAVTLEYNDNSVISDETYTYLDRWHIKSSHNTGKFLWQQIQRKHFMEVKTRYLTKINFEKGSVLFKNESRSDYQGQRVIGLEVKDHNGATVTDIKFNQSYFNSGDSYYKNAPRGYVTPHQGLRLKLNSVAVNGTIIQSFDYTNDKVIVGGIDKYELPPRDSFYYDHWGYFNGGGQHGATYDNTARVDDFQTTIGKFDFEGMSRKPSDVAAACALSKIEYPTGGFTRITYGFHTIHGGLRVDKLENFDENGLPISGSVFTYENEVAGAVPIYITDAPVTGEFYDVLDHSRSDIMDLNGPSVGYGKVTVTDLITQAKTVTTYNVRPISPRIKDKIKYRPAEDNNAGIVYAMEPNGQDGAPFTTNDLRYFDIGSPSEVISFDHAGKRLARNSTKYVVADSIYKIRNVALEYADVDKIGKYDEYYYTGEYTIVSRPVWVDNVRNVVYEDGDSLITTTKYAYHTIFKSIPWKTTTEHPDGSISEQQTKFAGDYSDSGNTAFSAMFARNMIAFPVYQKNFIQYPNETKKVVGASFSQFKVYNGNGVNEFIAPYYTTNLVAKDLINPDQIFDPSFIFGNVFLGMNNDWISDTVVLFDNQGRVIQQTGRDGITKSYTYDAKGYVTASTTSTGISSRSSQYQYKPLIGLTNVTDANEDQISYEYDSRYRLHLVRDNDGNIVKRYRYHSISDDDTFSGSPIQYTGFNKTGMPLNFSTNNAASHYGQTTYEWNFDNGTTEQTPTPAKVYSYGSAGAYMVQLKMENPEYQLPVTVSRMVNIYDLEAPLGIMGQSTYNSCTLGGGGSQPILAPESQLLAPSIIDDPVAGGSYQQVATYFYLGQQGEGAKCWDGPLSGITWEYRVDGGTWVNMYINEPMAALPSYILGCSTCTIDIRATADIGCGQGMRTAMHTLNVVYQCNTGGGGTGGGTGGGGGTLPPPDEFEPLSPHPGIIQEH